VSLIPKLDPGITNFLIPDPGIENSIPGLQSLVSSYFAMILQQVCFLDDFCTEFSKILLNAM